MAKFLSASKERDDPEVVVSPKGMPIAGHLLQPDTVAEAERGGADSRQSIWGDRPVYARNIGVQADTVLPVIETLRERLHSQHELLRPPPPPQQPRRPATPIKLPPTAIVAKKRHPNGPDVGAGVPRPERPRTRSNTPQPARSSAPPMPPSTARLLSRPLPPTPAVPSRSISRLEDELPIDVPQDTPGGLGLSNEQGIHMMYLRNVAEPSVYTHVDATPQLERFPSLRRAKALLDAHRLAEELESLASSTSRKSRSNLSASTATRIAEFSQEAICHWRPQDEEPSASLPAPLSRPRPERPAVQRKTVPLPSTHSSLYGVTSEESEEVQRIQQWRVQVKPAPSVVSKVASAHSVVSQSGDDVSSHLTSVSRSPLSKGSGAKSKRDDEECDPDQTPTLRAKRVVKLGVEAAHSYKGSRGSGSKRSGSAREPASHTAPSIDSKTSAPLGTQHIARLSSKQFDRLALAAEGPAPPPPTPIPHEATTPFLHPTHPTGQRDRDDDRRSSLDAAATTLSVLERKATTHIDTLDAMFRRHPDKMYEVLKKRPGLMLVVMLRCKVEDRLSEVASARVDLAPATSGQRKDHISLLEESLVELHFDDEMLQPTQKPANEPEDFEELEELRSLDLAVEGELPSILVSQHRTGSTAAAASEPSAAESITGENLGELGARSEAALREMVTRLEQAGELCSVQQTLLALQDRLLDTRAGCSRLEDRLRIVSAAVKQGRG